MIKLTYDNSPASRPAIVEELSDLPDKITKISSCGYVTAALTSANDAYFWGRGHPAELISGSPTPLDLDGQDILDVSVGFNHVIILTTEHKVYMVGNGENGQLGQSVEVLEDWKEIKLPLKDEQRIRSVQAGYKNTLLVIENAAPR
jgi:alpha-tubulin suppressor-like RCC1 family protein